MLEQREIAYIIQVLEKSTFQGVEALALVSLFQKLQAMHDDFNVPKQPKKAKK